MVILQVHVADLICMEEKTWELNFMKRKVRIMPKGPYASANRDPTAHSATRHPHSVDPSSSSVQFPGTSLPPGTPSKKRMEVKLCYNGGGNVL